VEYIRAFVTGSTSREWVGRYLPHTDVMITSATRETTMLKITVVAALLTGSASVALAQLDGDGNSFPGAQSVVSARQTLPSDGAYASQKPTRRPAIERDGDGNSVPGLE
jgi:hypothetical protein